MAEAGNVFTHNGWAFHPPPEAVQAADSAAHGVGADMTRDSSAPRALACGANAIVGGVPGGFSEPAEKKRSTAEDHDSEEQQ